MKHSISLITGAMLLLSGCGYKDLPVSPHSVVPMAIDDLRHEIKDDGVQLTWSYPVQTIKGSSVEEIKDFQLYRAGLPLNDYCNTCPIPFGSPQILPGGPSFDEEQRRVASFTSEGMKQGYKYFFKVSSRTGWFATSADSNIVSFIYSLPPATTAQLKGSTGNGVVNLRWQPVNQMTNGQPLLGSIQYQVFRDGEKIADSLSRTSYSDSKVQNDKRYQYAIRTVMMYSGEPVYGNLSEAITVKPKDTIAPDPPQAPRAVTTVEGIKVFWEPSSARDLDEYRVYRRANDEKEYSLLGTTKRIHTIYTDTTIQKNTRYYYVITAVDKSGNESQRSKSATTRD